MVRPVRLAIAVPKGVESRADGGLIGPGFDNRQRQVRYAVLQDIGRFHIDR